MNREDHIQQLKSHPNFDILVIGGGATGAGVAFDAASRGLSVALVEKNDFSSGTSSRSTKLIHGGVRYLEQAVKKLDRSQFNLVRDALKERSVLIQIAPHLAKPLPILTPIYSVLEVPYYLTGLKIYDRLAGKSNLKDSRYVSAKVAKERFPMLKEEGLRGAVIYYDGQFDDARMNVSVALTAAEQGAVIANHTEVTALLKTNGRLSGATVKDSLTGESFDINASVVINATGPFTDGIRHMDDPDAPGMLTASSGVHVVLDAKFSPPETGLLIPQTEDGRVLFILPWLGYTLVGTTDHPAPIEDNPQATEDEIQYILRHVDQYFDSPITREDVLASWSGLRPLVSDPRAADTARLSRDHVINISDSGLLTIAGGKWTTFRKMALDTVDEAIKLGSLTPERESQTEHIRVVGGENFESTSVEALRQNRDLEDDIAAYLHRAYGSRAERVTALMNGQAKRLVDGHPYTEAEVRYVVRNEAARSITDVLSRRMRLGFLDEQAATTAMTSVGQLMQEELGWDDTRLMEEKTAFKASMGV